ncbi:unnamed protein product [Paramecium primaurelia]|uniref:Uncharacterized protein n=1 Tax=Paramecium primaurelia TaxID=5886 RepID=A0A8S1PJK5_PARPR|nr:unnamed protein product [Paramecium primaurelia]
MLKLKREYFRNSIQKLAREEIFKKKRIVTNNNYNNESNPFNEKLNQLFESELTISDIAKKLEQLYEEYKLFPERNTLVLAQIKILSMKVATMKIQEHINDFYNSIKSNILTELIKYCSQTYADDVNTVELTNNSLWILINLTLADDCVNYLLDYGNGYFLEQINFLIKSKYEVIVHRVFELIFNMTVEEQACDRILLDSNFNESFLHRLKRQNSEIIMNLAASIIKNFCNNFRNENLQKILDFIFYCIRFESVNGLSYMITDEYCAQFLTFYRGLCLKLFTHPNHSINFINYLSSHSSNEVLDLLLDYPIVDELIRIKNSNHQVKVYSTFSNLATHQPFHNELRVLFQDIYEQYEKSDLKMKLELGYFVSTYIINCDPTFYGDLINNGVINLLVDFFREIYDPKAIYLALQAVLHLFMNENSKQIFEKLGGFKQLEKLRQNDNIIELASRLN